MNSKTLTIQLEIYFWQTLVALLKSPRAFLVAACGLVLLACLPASFLATMEIQGKGALLGGMAVLPEDSLVSEAQDLGFGEQQNILVVLVDELESSDPRLQGVWLAARLTSNTNVIWLPVFPSGGDGEQDQQLSQVMGLTPAGRLNRSFINQLSQRDLWWDYYVVIDYAGIGKMFELVGAQPPLQFAIGGVLDNTQFAYAPDDPGAALISQAMTIRSLCQKSPLLHRVDAINSLTSLSDHMQTSIDLKTIATELIALESHDSRLTQGSGISCEFPTFQEVSLVFPNE